MREEAFIGGGVSEIRITGEKIVQEGGAGAPMANDEDGRLIKGSASARLRYFAFGDAIEHEFHGTQSSSEKLSGRQFSVKL